MNGRPQQTCCGSDRLEAVPAQDLDRGERHVRLVVVRGAAVEEDDGPIRRRRRRPAADPAPCGAATGTSGRRTTGSGACRWMPIVHSISVRMSRLRSVQLASGANATPNRPTRSVWPSSQSRSRGRRPAFISARARLFISAIFTSAGQAVVHIPQPEQ